MKPQFLRLAFSACGLFLSGCSTWFFPYFPETRGTWTGKVTREAISRDVPDHRSAPTLIFTVTDGPPIRIHKNGAWSHAYTVDSKGVLLVLVDQKDRTILNLNLIGRSVRVGGVVSLTENPLDSLTGEAMNRLESDADRTPTIFGTKLWIIKSSINQIHLLTRDRDRKPHQSTSKWRPVSIPGRPRFTSFENRVLEPHGG